MTNPEPTNPTKPHPTPLPGRRVSRATDILLDPSGKAAQPRYAAYVRARHRFWEAFPRGGAYVRLPTPGADLECGFHALRLSMMHQLALTSDGDDDDGGVVADADGAGGAGAVDGAGAGPGAGAGNQLHDQDRDGGGGSGGGGGGGGDGGAVRVRIPTLAELRHVYRTGAVARENAAAGMDNDSWFTADQLAAVFAEWGRRYQGGSAVRCQMGYVADDGVPVMMNTPWVDTGEVGEGIVRVWVYNDGWSLRGGVGHFEGIRRPTEEELASLSEGREGDGSGAEEDGSV
ncbi:9ee122a7-77d8-46b9-941f-ffe2bd976737 [Thermothielavioides terrestris]|uniref:9ee122a7-77d8-46b9-941f-ffe2bd976737 n=1 Tax=Thermothielavioides terrestris TaxID=2587410 RepID=A0A446BRK5_9PEZI|nr:9ee122a7-77d8-46b9-941f-ffe2bd976737 [Thermothielavioides terrestris]